MELALYARDAGVARGRAAAVCWPATGDDVAAAVRIARRHERPFVARGSGTGLAGGATPVGDPVVIVTTHMNRVLEVDTTDRTAWVEPGVLNLDLTRAVQHLGLHYAPDPSSQQACTVGGNVATNAGGPHALKYGVTGAWVTGIEAVLAPGELVELGGWVRKDVAGYDIRSLLIGSEGTLGVITAVRLRLLPAPEAAFPLVLFLRSRAEGCAAIRDVFAAGLRPSVLDFLDGETLAMLAAAFRGTGPGADGQAAAVPAEAQFALIAEVDGAREEARAQREARGRSASPRTRPNARSCGRVASRRSEPSLASRPTTTSTTPSCPAPVSSRCWNRSTRSPRSTS